MARKRVIAHFMHEHEQSAAEHALTTPLTTEGYVLGEIEENQIPALRQQGLIVQELRDPTPPDVVPPGPMPAGVLPPPAPAANEPTYYTLGLRGPLVEPRLAELRGLGVELLQALGGDRYTVRCSPDAAARVAQLPFVAWATPFTPSAAPAVPAPAAAPPREARLQTFEVLLHRSDDREAVAERLRDHPGVLVAGVKGRKIRFHALEGSSAPYELRQLREVFSVEEWVPPRLHNERARALLGVDRPGGNPATLPWTGAGQTVAVADTGIDAAHPDLANQLAQVVALGRPGDASDPHGHGTHVAGSVLGDGTASAGQIRGVAPGARLYFQSVLDAQERLGGLPWDLNDLFAPAYAAGARIHNNSWGSATGSEYVVNSLEVDAFVASHRDMLIVISAGNEGTAASPRNSQPGFVDWLSIDSPASCKNALTVGASRSDRTSGGYAILTYGTAWPAEFPADPIAGQSVSGDPQSMAGFSSRGPCTDRRVKPDVVAPGTDIVSARSSSAPLHRFWGSFPGFAGRYAYMGGTSMAAPLVAGCAALVRQYYVEDRQHAPSAALLKATLINGARWLTGADAGAEFATAPNFHQGFGCVDLPGSLPSPFAPNLRLEFVDPWEDATARFTGSGERRRWRIQVGGGAPLRVCLVWTDPPARALQNNLNLFLEHSLSGQKWTGNADLPLAITAPDVENNVEIIRLMTPTPGEYVLQITASNLTVAGGQDFALVVTGDLGSTLQPMP